MAVISRDLGPITAYAAAVNRGYTGTREEFEQLMASYATVAEQAGESASQAAGSADDAESSATAAAASASIASSSANAAATSAGNASSSASAAQSAQTAAESARDATQTAQSAAEAAQAGAEATASNFDTVVVAAIRDVNATGTNQKELAKRQAEKSEAWAVGQISGEDVGVSDPAYHNNAKYYAGQAGTSATTATTKAGEAATSATNAAASASAAAQSAQSWNKKVNAPLSGGTPVYGESGQHLITNGDGTTEWANTGLPTDEQTAQAVSDWLDEHPEATTTVQDDSLAETKFTEALKLKTIKDYITPQMFGALGDGETDDTNAIQACLNAMSNGMCFYLPKGTYVITQVSTKNISDCRYLFDGTFKLKDNTRTPFGMFIAAGENCLYDGLKIDGNVENAIDEESYGVSCCLLVSSYFNESIIQNLYIYDSVYCACCVNGNATDSTFKDCIFNNIGEHCIYFGGNNSNNWIFENIRAFNIGMNAYNAQGSHDCHVVKVKGSDCSNFLLIGVILQQDDDPVATVHVLDAAATNMILDKCKALGRATSLALPTSALNGLTIINSYANRYGIYGPQVSNKEQANIRMINCEMGVMIHSEFVKEFINCTFKALRSLYSQLSSKLTPTYFKGCTFITNDSGSTTWANFSNLNCDLYFIDSKFKNVAQSGGSYAIAFGGSGSQPDLNIVFDNVIFEDTTYHYNILFNNVNINARILNSKLNKSSIFKVNFLQIFNTQWEAAYRILSDSRNTYALSSFAYVFKNWADVSDAL